MNFTAAHTSLAVNQTTEPASERVDTQIYDQLKITIGIPTRVSETNIGGTVLMDETFWNLIGFWNFCSKLHTLCNSLEVFLSEIFSQVPAILNVHF